MAKKSEPINIDDLKHKEQLALLEAAETHMAERVESAIYEMLSTDYDEKDWHVIFDESKCGRQELLSQESIENFRNKSRWLYWKGSEYMRRAVDNSVNYVVGQGLTYGLENTKEEHSPETVEKVMRVWDMFDIANHWQAKERETVQRGELDGEWFYRFKEKNGMLRVRFLEPEHINNGTSSTKWPLGIKHDLKDVEDVESYFWNPTCKATDPEELSANEIYHGFWFGTRSMIRGIPPYIPILNRIKQYDGWINDRLILNKLRSRIALIRKHIGATKSQVTNFADSNKDGDTLKPAKAGGTYRRKMYEPGSIIDAHGNTEYEFLSPNVQASDVRFDGRAVLLSITSGTGQTEVMITSDASNSNFASTWIAEAPAVRQFAVKQAVLTEAAKAVWHKVMLWAQGKGSIPEHPEAMPDEGFSGYDVEIEAPMLVSRDRDKETKANETMNTAGTLSKKTWMLRDNLDPEKEKAQIAKEELEDLEMGHVNEPIPEPEPATEPGEGADAGNSNKPGNEEGTEG